MSVIAIEGMEFYAHHGCHEEEQVTGNRFVVDVYLEKDTGLAERSDNLADTINYAEIYTIIQAEMAIPSKLLEHLGRRILNAIKVSFPGTGFVELKVSKMNPPIGGNAGSVSLIMTDEG
jgi:dihydroneopterin aldolase